MIKQKIKKNKGLNKQKKIIIAILFGIIVLGLFLLIILKLTTNKVNNNQTIGLTIDDFYSDEQCRCLERENLRCSNSSWQLDLERKACIYEKSITNVVLGCSRYECNGITYVLNMDIKTWEVK